MTRQPTVAVLIEDPARRESWLAGLREAFPECLVLDGDEVRHPAGVDFAVVWKITPGRLAPFRNLKGILSTGAGVDSVLADRSVPPTVPVVRMVDDALTVGMREYVMLHVLRHHRREPERERHQRRREWKPLMTPLAGERRVGVMGLGVLGTDAVRHLAAFGFDAAGWSRRPRAIEGVGTWHGEAGLTPFLGRTAILVCLLPLTDDTRGILDAGLFARLPRGACVINAARGEHLAEPDLLAALDSGQLGGATLDVFRNEPLPPESPLWTHPAVTVTPHNASLTRVDSGARSLAASLRSLWRGELPASAADRTAGY